jgi:uncharacterized protein YbcI
VDMMRAGDGRLGRAAVVFSSERDGASSPGGTNRIVATALLRLPVPARQHADPSTGPMLADVTNAIVRLHRQLYGKGPTRSKSFLLDDVLVCVMRDVLTTVERTLVEAGEHTKVRDTRFAFEEATRERFIEAVEGIVGRKVLGMSSQVLVTRDIAIEMFVLEPVSRPPEA